MLFKVKYKEDGQIHVVYSVQRKQNGDTEFLICNKGFVEQWRWVNAEDCTTQEE